MKASKTIATTFKITLDNKEVVRVDYKPYNGLLVLFSFYGCVSETGYMSHFMYVMDKTWEKYDDVKLLAKDIAQCYYNKYGFKYRAVILKKQQLSLF